MSTFKPVKIAYTWDKKTFSDSFEASYKYEFNHSAKKYIGWFFIALLQFGVVATLKAERIGLLMFSTIMLFYWYYFRKLFARKKALKSFEASDFVDKKISILVEEDGFHVELSGKKDLWAWGDIEEIKSIEGGFLVYKRPNFHYIPVNGFESFEERSRFKGIIKKMQKASSK